MTQKPTSDRTFLACILLSFAFVISAEAQSTRWKEYVSEKGKFSVLLPGVPTLRYQSGDVELGTVVVSVTKIEKGEDVWQIAYSDLPVIPPDAMAVKKLLEVRRDRNSADRGSAKTLTLNRNPAIEFKTSFPDGEYVRVTRVILVKQRIYELWAITDARKAASEEVTKFFDSFKPIPLTDEDVVEAAKTAMADKEKTRPRKLVVSTGVLEATAIKKVQPLYPPEAKAAGASGWVKIQILVSEKGSVIEAKTVEGHPLLRGSALDAARMWVFKPTEIEGIPVKVQGILLFKFRLR